MSTAADSGTARDYDIEQRFQALISRLDERLSLTPIALDPQLAEPRSFLKILRARHMNWRAERFRKIFGMRFSVKIPSLDQVNFIRYPEPEYDTPIFLLFCLLTGRKLIAHVNVNCAFRDETYFGKWVAPLLARIRLQKYVIGVTHAARPGGLT
jgi:hypothetical protein